MICENLEKSNEAVKEIFDGKFGKADQIVIEEFLVGEEMSFFVIYKCYKRNWYMYHKKVLIFCFFVFFIIFSKQIYAYLQDIVTKYDDIFSSKVLSEEDVYNYQQAYKFQDIGKR